MRKTIESLIYIHECKSGPIGREKSNTNFTTLLHQVVVDLIPGKATIL